jgi:hypothetical protein
MFDLSDVGYVLRITVGSRDPQNLSSEKDIQAAVALLNRCLSESPRARIVGIEKTFNLLNIGEHQVVLQSMIYHVGFVRKPFWLTIEEEQRQNGAG